MRARKRFGQHFLEPSYVRKVIAAIAPGADDAFIEIGPGRGALTLPLAAACRRVVAVEIDRDLAAALVERAPARVTVVEGDVLDADLEALVAGLPGDTRVRLAGNLPYNISSPILFRVLALHARAPRVHDATLMLQREVADRLTAQPRTRDYGVLTVCVAVRARVSQVLALPPGAFRPPPAVDSALVRLDFLPESQRPVLPHGFDAMVRTAFTQRRKTLANALEAYAGRLGRSARAALDAAGIDARARPDALSVNELLRVARALEADDGAARRCRPRA